MPKILILDDEPVNRYLMSSVLTHGGHEIYEAASGDDALRIAREQRPQLIIMDLFMPGMSGAEFIKALRNDPMIAQTPIALYTSSMLDDSLRDFIEMTHIACVIPKPSEPLEIIRIVGEALEVRERR